jgi:prevent-host-death family protein
MASVSISDLSRNASKVVGEVERSRRPAIVTNHGRVVAALIPVDQEQLEDFILANAPQFVASLAEADDDLREGRVHHLDDVLAEIDAEKRKNRPARAPRR